MDFAFLISILLLGVIAFALVPAPLWSDAVEGSILLALGLWPAPRVIREHEILPADSELAVRAPQLTQRAQALTRRVLAVLAYLDS